MKMTAETVKPAAAARTAGIASNALPVQTAAPVFVKANTKQINSLASDTKKLSKTTKNEEKDMQKTLKNNQRLVDQNNKEIQKMAAEIEKEEMEMNSISSEIESLTAQQESQQYSSSSFGISDDGSMQGSGMSGGSRSMNSKLWKSPAARRCCSLRARRFRRGKFPL